MVKKSNLLIAGIAIIAAGSVATYLYLRNVALKVSSPLGSAQIVPESAIMATFFQPDSEAINKLQQFGTPEAKKLINQSYIEFQQENLAETNIDWKKDVKPWLGGVMLAFVPAEKAQDSNKVNLLMVVGIKNKLELWKFANKLKGEEKTKVVERKYQGVTIQEVTDESGKVFNLAILGNYLAIAPIASAVEDAIDTFQGKNVSLRKNAAESLQESAGLEDAIFTMIIPNYSQFITEFADELEEEQNLSTASLEQLQKINSIVMGIGVDDAGVRMRAITKLVSPLSPELTQPTSGEILQRFPTETIMLISGMGISETWSQFVTQAEINEDFQDGLDIVRETFEEVGLDVDRDVFSWMDGEFALGLITSNEGLLATTGVGGAMVIDTSDRPAAEATLQKLNQMALENGGVAVREKQVGGKSVTEWQMVGIGPFLGYGWLDDNSLFVAVGQPLVEVMLGMSGNGLVGSEGFEEILGSLPKSNQGYFYLDMEKAMVWANSFPAVNMVMSPETKAIFGSIRGIGVTASWSDDLTNEMEMLLGLRKNIN